MLPRNLRSLTSRPANAGRFRGVVLAALALLSLVQSGCAASFSRSRDEAAPQEGAFEGALTQLADLIEDLYVAFSFDANGEADWGALRAVLAEGATFFAPIQPGGTPVGVDGATFLRDFRAFIQSSPLGETGYHERVIHTRVDRLGSIAHAWVTFEAFVPGQPVDRRGVDSIEFVQEGAQWKLASFTTQYETEDCPLPERFLAAR